MEQRASQNQKVFQKKNSSIPPAKQSEKNEEEVATGVVTVAPPEQQISEEHRQLMAALVTGFEAAKPRGPDKSASFISESKKIYKELYASSSDTDISSVFETMNLFDSCVEEDKSAGESPSKDLAKGDISTRPERSLQLTRFGSYKEESESGGQVAVIDCDEDVNTQAYNPAMYIQAMSLNLLMVEMLAKFAKTLPGFLNLECADQAALIKGSFVEFLCLTSIRLFDLKEKCFVSMIMPGKKVALSNLVDAGFPPIVTVIEYATKLAKLKLSDQEFILIVAIRIVSPDHPELLDSTRPVVSAIQEKLLNALTESGHVNHAEIPNFLAKVVAFLTDLQPLITKCESTFVKHKLNKRFFQPLLSEIFDGQDEDQVPTC
ncbi:uncharacterized protein [Amphiura filiformis]|uniref:uncharacterized protein n=1 Tax=Amphiura filiformis TaxID=82378 RepID=UPI003B214101